MNFIVLFPIFIFSIIFHEYAHAFMAQKCGDDTAYLSGRLTLNPLKHIDIFGTIILPLLLYLSGVSFLIGWAKPVPINHLKFNNFKTDMIKVAVSGIIANFILVFFTLILIFILRLFPFESSLLIEICKYAVYINVLLAFFNLLPIPPLDGAKIFYPFVKDKIYFDDRKLEIFGFIFLIILVNIPFFRNIFFNTVVFISESFLRVVL